MGRAIRRSHNLENLMAPLAPFRDDEEVVINRPGEAFVWRDGGFQRFDVDMDEEDLTDLAHVAMAQRRADAGERNPLPGTDLDMPDGRLLRFQAFMPPCVREGSTAIAIRQATDEDTSVEEIVAGGVFDDTRRVEDRDGIDAGLRDVINLYRDGNWLGFLKALPLSGLTTLLVGANGTGKSHIGRALLREVPLDERLCTLAHADELSRLPHRNAVHAYYAKDGHGGRPRATKVVEAFKRMRIGRPVVAEVADGDSTLAFLNMSASGHRGGITTGHAPSTRGAIKTLRVMLKGTDDGRAMGDDDLDAHLRDLIHVVIHTERTRARGFKVPEVWFPAAEGGGE